MNNMWMVEEILEELRSMARMYTSAMKRCNNEMNNFKDVYHTDDKFEATRNEYWRTRKLADEEFVNDIQGLIDAITEMIDDKPEEWKFSEDVKGDELPW